MIASILLQQTRVAQKHESAPSQSCRHHRDVKALHSAVLSSSIQDTKCLAPWNKAWRGSVKLWHPRKRPTQVDSCLEECNRKETTRKRHLV